MAFKGQAFAVGVITACGVGILIMALGAIASLQQSRDVYYERYRFADVFADMRRAPENIVEDVRRIEGIKSAEGRITHTVILDIERLNEPANARLVSVPDEGEPRLNNIYLYSGRWPDASITFAEPQTSDAVDEIARLLGGVAVELARNVYVRMRYDHIAERGSITGLKRHAALRQVLSAARSPQVLSIMPRGFR